MEVAFDRSSDNSDTREARWLLRFERVEIGGFAPLQAAPAPLGARWLGAPSAVWRAARSQCWFPLEEELRVRNCATYKDGRLSSEGALAVGGDLAQLDGGPGHGPGRRPGLREGLPPAAVRACVGTTGRLKARPDRLKARLNHPHERPEDATDEDHVEEVDGLQGEICSACGAPRASRTSVQLQAWTRCCERVEEGMCARQGAGCGARTGQVDAEDGIHRQPPQ